MLDFASQIGAFVGTSFVLFLATKPKRNNFDSAPQDSPRIFLKGAKKYSKAGRKLTSFGEHDDFEM